MASTNRIWASGGCLTVSKFSSPAGEKKAIFVLDLYAISRRHHTQCIVLLMSSIFQTSEFVCIFLSILWSTEEFYVNQMMI